MSGHSLRNKRRPVTRAVRDAVLAGIAVFMFMVVGFFCLLWNVVSAAASGGLFTSADGAYAFAAPSTVGASWPWALLSGALWPTLLLSAVMAVAVGWLVWWFRNKLMREAAERQRLTAALEDSEAKFRSIAELAGEYIWECDLDGRYLMLSDRVIEVLGYRPEEMLGRFAWEFVPADQAAAYRASLLAKFKTGRKFTRITHPKLAKDGQIVWLATSGSPFHDAQGKLIGYRGIGEDVTAQREYVENLKKAKQAAEAADRAKSEFLAVMSHEIRTPMNGVIGFANLLANTKLDSQQREFVETIHESSEALLLLINDILDFSKIESGHMTLENVPFNVRNCIFGVLNLTAQSASRKDIELLGEISEDVPEWIHGDVARLRQVLINLVGNAIKFTNHGQVVVAVHTHGTTQREGQLEYRLGFEVRDTGIGIPADRIEMLFKPFSQADSSTTRKFGGTGLGLAICKRLVNLMGGEIGVVSQPGKGSVFYFDIRATLAEPNPQEDMQDNIFDVQKRLLVVAQPGLETDRVVNCLRDWGVQIEQAFTPDDALAILAGDMALDGALVAVERGGDVFDPARRLREARDGLPFILLGEDASRLAAEDGGAHYLAGVSTPLVVEQLFEAVAQVLSQSRGTPSRRIIEARLALQPEVANEHSKLKVLLAEDNQVNKRVATLMLEKLGCHVESVSNGRHALERSADGSFDIILMDIQMPEMDGIEAAKAIRERERQSNTRPLQIIALTADAMQGDRERTQAAGMDDYLTKPLKPEPLKAALARARERISQASVQPEK